MHDRVAVQVLSLENALGFGPHLLLSHVRFDHLAADDLDHVQTVFDRSGRGHRESSHRFDAPDIAVRRHGADLAHHRDGRTVGIGAAAEWGVQGGHRRDAGRARVFFGPYKYRVCSFPIRVSDKLEGKHRQATVISSLFTLSMISCEGKRKYWL